MCIRDSMWVIPLRIGVGWGDLYINLHEHTFHSEIGHFSGLWSNAYSGINAVSYTHLDKEIDIHIIALSGIHIIRYGSHETGYVARTA